MQGTVFNKATDVALAVVIPLHSHVALNSVISDYLPSSSERHAYLSNVGRYILVLLLGVCCIYMAVWLALLIARLLPTLASDLLIKCVHVAGVARWGALGASTVAFVGLMKLSLAGPGLSATVKQLWRKPTPSTEKPQ